jgi:hypothetical protein
MEFGTAAAADSHGILIARQWLRDHSFIAPNRCRGTRDILGGRGGNGGRETKKLSGAMLR